MAVIALACTAACGRGAGGGAPPARAPTVTAAQTPSPPAGADEGRPVTDAEISEAVSRELSRDPAVPAAAIRVTTTNGIVMLTGTAADLLARDRATRHAEVVKGVRTVDNRIEVDPPEVDDLDLAVDVRNALAIDPATDAYELAIDAKDGVVTLRGAVQSIQEKIFAETVAKGVRGVARVENAIDVLFPETRPDREIARDVAARLRWDVLVDDGLIDVRVRDGTVHLTGAVGSAAEKARAAWDAWVTGAKDVDASRLEVRWWQRNDDLRRNKYAIKAPADVERAVRDALAYDPRVDASGIRVSVSGGVATLKGEVASPAAKTAAVGIARHTVGVLTVNDHLEVRPPEQVADAELGKRVHMALMRHPVTESFEIQTTATDGMVVLRGAVDSPFEKTEAESVAAQVSGVRHVENRLEVEAPGEGVTFDPYIVPYDPYFTSIFVVAPEPLRPDPAIAQDIERELFWSPFVDADDVLVTVEGGRATLTGVVDTWRERRVAAEKALQAGAIAVENKIAVR